MNVDEDINFAYIKSCQLPVNMKVKINSVDKERPPPSSLEILQDPLLEFSPWAHPTKAADLVIQCQVFDGNFSYSLKAQTAFVHMSTRWDWYEWLALPVLISDLPRYSKLVFTVWDSRRPGEMFCIGTASVDVFDAYGEMNTGKKDLRIVEDPSKEDTPEVKEIVRQLNELDAKQSRYDRGHTERIDWMDRLVFREIGELTEKLKRESGSLFLSVEFPTFKSKDENLSVFYFEQGALSHYTTSKNPKYCKLYDPSAGMDNIIEKKHLSLARSLRSGFEDKDIKPNADIKKKLHAIMEYPPTVVLTGSELDMVWKHRYYLSEHKAGLTKFMRCINWENPDQRKEAKHLLNRWALLDAENALELVGPSFTVPEVRRYAVTRLGECSDDDLMLYLLQLVQALKFEPFTPDTFTFNEAYYSDDSTVSGAGSTPHKRQRQGSAVDNVSVASKEDTVSLVSNTSTVVGPPFLSAPGTDSASVSGVSAGASIVAGGAGAAGSGGGGGLLELLVTRASRHLSLATSLYWFLRVECGSNTDKQQQQQGLPEGSSVCQHALDQLMITLRSGSASARYTAECLERQQMMVDRLKGTVQEMRSKNLNRDGKVLFLQNTLGSSVMEMEKMKQPLPLPLDPLVLASGIDVSNIVVFKSALEPCKLTFTTVHKERVYGEERTKPGPPYHTIFKLGDDLRQDQLILQLLTLMDRLLLRENLDLKLTPYRVLATAPDHGFVQFIDAAVLADILREDASILNYLRRKQPDPDAAHGVAPQVLDNYIRSCAGYCIITYILGVGDRHHDNLMLTSDGCFFHIDFGYILGRDPKPLPPLIKLSRDMTDAFGGQGSENYRLFRQLCRTTFLSLRRHAKLVLNLFSLMVNASIPDIALEPEKAVRKVEERLHLDMTDEEASSKIMSVLHESANDVMGAVAENLHKFTQYIRN